MKFFIATLFAVFPLISDASTKTIVCDGGSETSSLSAVIDDSEYQPSSGYFDVKSANIRVEFATAALTCVGGRLNELSCIGFWFGSGQMIVNVTFHENGGQLSATSRNLTKAPVSDGFNWPCVIQ